MIELIATIKNEYLGLEASIMDGNEEFNYRVVCRDLDAEQTVKVIFTNSYFQCQKYAREFIGA